MLAILSAVLGFASPFLPELFKWLNRKQDNAHEKEMMELRLKAGAQEHLWKMEEVTAEADIAEAKQLHMPVPSFGVQMLDAAKDSGWKGWATIPAFYLFIMLDFLSGMVRPVITYSAFGFYILYKVSSLYMMKAVADESFTVWEGARALWGEQDWMVLTLVLSYWFGTRAYKATFGGSASSSKPSS